MLTSAEDTPLYSEPQRSYGEKVIEVASVCLCAVRYPVLTSRMLLLPQGLCTTIFLWVIAPPPPIVLGFSCAMSGTDLRYAPIRSF